MQRRLNGSLHEIVGQRSVSCSVCPKISDTSSNQSGRHVRRRNSSSCQESLDLSDILLKGRVLIYEALTFRSSCPHYKPRSWERPHTCGECQRRQSAGSDGRFRCSGYPFTSPRSMDDEACVNGKVEVGAQLTLF